MLRLADFDLQMPGTLAEAREAVKAALGPAGPARGVCIIAGGTDIIPKMKRGQFEPARLVSLSRIRELAFIEDRGDALHIGAATTLRSLEEDGLLDRYTAFREAARLVATPIIRNMATLGGNLLQDTRCRFYDRTEFWREAIGYCMKKDADICRVAPGGNRCFASFCSDLAPALFVLDARVQVVGDSERELSIGDLYQDDGMSHIRLGGEILSQVMVPSVPERRSTYRKLRVRESFDFPEIGVAVSVVPNATRFDVRAAVTSVSSGMVTATETIDRGDIPGFVERVYKAIKPVDTMFLPPAYRRKVARNLLLQALDELLPPR